MYFYFAVKSIHKSNNILLYITDKTLSYGNAYEIPKSISNLGKSLTICRENSSIGRYFMPIFASENIKGKARADRKQKRRQT